MTNKWLKSAEHVTFDVSNRIATITLNRPGKRNAISHVMLREYHQAQSRVIVCRM